MDKNQDFETKLKKSGAVQSLEAEYRVGRLIQENAFYVDPLEKKSREIDVQARQIWIKGETDSFHFDFLVRLGLAVECKTLRGFHLVFPEAFPSHSPVPPFRSHRYWAGEDHEVRRRLQRWLQENKVPAAKTDAISRLLSSISHPQEFSVVHDIIPEPMSAERVATTFAETNTNNDKELENSVLWRATSTLRSAAIAIKTSAHDRSFEWLTSPAEGKSRLTERDLNEIVAHWNRECHEVDVWQYVVVVEADLWGLSDGKLEAVSWVRLSRTDESGFSGWWCDIVQADAASEYFRKVSSHWSKFLTKQGFSLRD